jgi:hypothetical protein
LSLVQDLIHPTSGESEKPTTDERKSILGGIEKVSVITRIFCHLAVLQFQNQVQSPSQNLDGPERVVEIDGVPVFIF